MLTSGLNCFSIPDKRITFHGLSKSSSQATNRWGHFLCMLYGPLNPHTNKSNVLQKLERSSTFRMWFPLFDRGIVTAGPSGWDFLTPLVKLWWHISILDAYEESKRARGTLHCAQFDAHSMTWSLINIGSEFGTRDSSFFGSAYLRVWRKRA